MQLITPLTLAKLAESYIVFDKVDTTMALPLVREALTIDEKKPKHLYYCRGYLSVGE